MLGVLHACRSTLDDDLLTQWQAHLCGLCLTLRDGTGQLARTLVNTDAVLLSVLTEAQCDRPAPRTQAGPCPLRGMRTAAVVPASDLAVRLGATASLTLAAAKAGDVAAERAAGTGGRGLTGLRGAAVGTLAGPLRRRAVADPVTASAVGVTAVLDDLDTQVAVEAAVRPGDPLAAVTAPTARACARMFATSARLAGRPANEAPLHELGAAFGALAHLLDAVEDLDADRRSGAFNPVLATGTPLSAVHRECRRLAAVVRDRFAELELVDGRLARTVLVDGTRRAVHQAFAGDGTCATATQPDAPPAAPPVDPAAPTDPDTPAEPPPVKPPQPRPFWRALLPWVGVYCTGYACCADHENPCTGRQHPAGCTGGCDGCSSCGDCDGCCDCCDCCDCNC